MYMIIRETYNILNKSKLLFVTEFKSVYYESLSMRLAFELSDISFNNCEVSLCI